MHVEGLEFVIIAVALFTGATLQGTLGFGMTMLAFPALVLIEPALLPQTTLIVSLPLVFYLAYRNWGDADLREVAILTSGRVPGLILAVVIIERVSQTALALSAGFVVLLGVGLSLWAPAVKRTTPTLLAAGTVSALFGTTVSIGGPPLGLLYQHEAGPRLRSTISLLMVFGAPVSFLFLALSGNVSGVDLRTGLALMPFGLAGSYSSRWVIPLFDQRLRPIVLSVCALAAVLAMARVAIDSL